jgi:NAD-dependent DNA ligase
MTKPLSGCKICCTGLTSEDEDRAISRVEYLGGDFSRNLTKDVTCLIVKRVGSKKHQIALSSNIPDVEIQWLLDCKTSGSRLPFDTYRVRPFTGLTISVTGFQHEQRFQLQKVIMENGGTFSSSLVRESSTHLVAEKAGGDKYTYAKSWGTVSIVSDAWVRDCATQKRKL